MADSAYSDPVLYLYTSLTAGSSHIITATSRMETILKANKIPFRAVDCATDEKARTLWGRRSKGRKLPGLVKYGSIIGDLEQIEEWNEYGELKEQIAEADEFGSLGHSTVAVAATANPTASLMPEPPVSSTNASTPQRSGPPSRASSETRHISIAEPPKAKESTARTAEPAMNQTIRQLGAEAAAKAGQKKAALIAAAKSSAAAASSPKSPSAPSSEQPILSPPAAPTAATKLSADAAVDSGSEEVAAVTAAKAPTQLAAEGARRTSVDKVAETESVLTSPTSVSPTAADDAANLSKEEQLLNMRRSSSTTKTKSRLSEATPVLESESVLAERPKVEGEKAEEDDKKVEGVPGDKEADALTKPAPESVTTQTISKDDSPTSPSASTVSVDSKKPVVPVSGRSPVSPSPRRHRGSDVSEASPEEIRAIEKALSIKEEDEDEDEEEKVEKPSSSASTIAATPAANKSKPDVEAIEEEEEDGDDDENDKEAKSATTSQPKTEAKATEGDEQTQDQEPKDESKVGVGVGD